MKKVLITGGNRGIGYQITKVLIENNYKVYCLGRDFQDFDITHKNLSTIRYDLSDLNHIKNIIIDLGSVDVLINNAGYMTANDYLDYPVQDIDKMLAVNLRAPLELISCVLPDMKKNNWGRIINIASLAGIKGHPDIWYGITKAGLINAGVSVSKLLKETNVTINSISPGPVNTKMMASVPEIKKQGLREKLFVTGGYMDPIQIAWIVLWLCSESSIAVTGQNIEVNDSIIWK